MMNGRIEPGAAPEVVVSDVDVVAELMVTLNRENERAEREAMRDERMEAEAAGELRLGQMKEAADLRLVSGIVSGSVKIGSSVSTGVAAMSTAPTGAAAADTTDAAEAPSPTAEGAEVAAPEHDNSTRDWATAVGGGGDGVGQATTALLGELASSADQRAERARMAMDRASSRSEERQADAEAAARSTEKVLEGLSSALSERRRAEEAATRA